MAEAFISPAKSFLIDAALQGAVVFSAYLLKGVLGTIPQQVELKKCQAFCVLLQDFRRKMMTWIVLCS
jgi:hypothetical protein